MIDLTQGTDEWRMARAGSLGASQLHEALAKTKTGWGASRANLMATLIVEQLTGRPQDGFQSAAMLHGIETEPEARDAYSFYQNADVIQVGLVRHPSIGGTHASPDGLVGSDGLVEIKCPQPAAHLETLLTQTMPNKYVLQALWQMACCDRSWCDLVSYSPAFPESMRLFVKRIERDPAKIAELEGEVIAFLQEVRERVDALRSRYEPRSEPVSVLVAC